MSTQASPEFQTMDDVRAWLKAEGFGPTRGASFVKGNQYAAIERLPSGLWTARISTMEGK